ncbi:hypothetical protein B9N58_00365 [Finegoldia magna]|uniref:YkvA family protein n=1 Tax=Finegoldia magna TaxID=1260 RepID=UPI000B915F86|nr:DUF1232 domain-containing protein [Finegoldia magna]OXZ41721.1 hypothetical protein B9N58_00365 [Finegoldia magna]
MIKKIFGLKNEIPTLWYAFFNKQTPLFSKIILALSVLYVVSPVDFVPDFLAGLGILDDLILAPSLMMVAKKFIPEGIIDTSEEKAEQLNSKLKIFAIVAGVGILLLISFLIYKNVGR